MAIVRRTGSTSVDVRIHQRQIDRFVQPGGEVFEWSRRVLLRAKNSARRRVSIGTAKLLAGIDIEIETVGPSRVTATLGTDGVPYASHYLLGHAPQGGVRNRPIGAAMVRRGMANGQINRRAGKGSHRAYGGTPRLFTNGPIAGWAGNNALADALAEAYASEGLAVTPESFTWG